MASIPLLGLSLPPRKPFAPSAAAVILTARSPHPLRSTATIPLPLRRPPPPRRTTISMSYNPTPAADRLISAASYLLPLFNGLQYGRFLFSQYLFLAVAFEPIFPLLSLYRSIPYGSFVAFFALYLAVARNPRLSRYARFNAMQAVVLDVLLSLPQILLRIFNPGRAGLGYKIMVMGHNVVFVFIVACFFYSLGCCILGRTPYLPLVAEASERQL
ncbi:protein TIC 20-II, chloroplastic [Actinidia eriantha]|uniref:protein TIC 20-II, chloroplastic n=1 Tax=Actinidia eriantha TaxID=165200 RepID=UPI00258E1F29|nr:protein TIC 20-II, chloroplastic [Actinidia eriantha]